MSSPEILASIPHRPPFFMKIFVLGSLVATILMGLGGCGIIYRVKKELATPDPWPPSTIQMDTGVSYVTGTSRYAGPTGLQQALANANAQTREMGFKDYTLTEVCQDPDYYYDGYAGTRVLYRVIPATPKSPAPSEKK